MNSTKQEEQPSADAVEVVARLMTWKGPDHYAVKPFGIIARTFDELPKDHYPVGYWAEGEPLIRLSDYERARAADRAEIERLKNALQRVDKHYETKLEQLRAELESLKAQKDAAWHTTL